MTESTKRHLYFSVLACDLFQASVVSDPFHGGTGSFPGLVLTVSECRLAARVEVSSLHKLSRFRLQGRTAHAASQGYQQVCIP